MILTNGYYKSELIGDVESHGGGEFYDFKYNYLAFFENNRFWAKSLKRMEPIRRKDVYESLNNSRIYNIKNDSLELYFGYNSEFQTKLDYKIISSIEIVDRDFNKYHFHPWPEE